eukprot:SAG22_NODE_947_length_6367_cov_23.437460_3_plen_55_part_00
MYQPTPANYQLSPVLSHDWDVGSSGYRARRIEGLLQVSIGPTHLSMLYDASPYC